MTYWSINDDIQFFCPFYNVAYVYNEQIWTLETLRESINMVLEGHESYINDVRFDFENKYLASTSDDNTVKLWYTDGFQLKATFNVDSPAMVVAWHRSDPKKLLVAEKLGIVKFYNVETETPILSLDFAKSLCSAHWAPSDSQILATLQLGELLLWDLTKPFLPQNSTIIFPENGGTIQFSPQGELLAAVNSLDGSLKVVQTVTQTLKLSAQVSLPSNVQWHYLHPIVCVADDTKLYFWRDLMITISSIKNTRCNPWSAAEISAWSSIVFTVCEYLRKTLFADDTSVCWSGMNDVTMDTVMNKDMRVIKVWFNINNLVLNVDKTKLMTFSKKQHITSRIR
ncbi:unnamed protein product [Ceutorhynchus assimilis]|uniref:Nucleoporin Nup37 n=1 Tax=Ceutorhynchus assimilis TaxID=467358 RepID=A0A9N9MD78_9CUCU|nr:unnamed protein product [Ceutorhynchus assimilis]